MDTRDGGRSLCVSAGCEFDVYGVRRGVVRRSVLVPVSSLALGIQKTPNQSPGPFSNSLEEGEGVFCKGVQWT